MGDKQQAQPASLFVRLRRALFGVARDYVLIVRGGSEGAGLATLKGLAHSGPLSWLGLAALAVSLVAAAYLTSQGHRYPSLEAEVYEGLRVTVPSISLYLALLCIAFGWAYLLAGTAAAGLGAFVFTAIYVAFYGLLIGISLGGSPWFTIIPFWLLILGGWVAASRPIRWRLPLLLLLSLTVSMLVYPSLGLKAILPATWGRWVLAIVLFLLLANPLSLRRRALNPSLVFIITFLLFMGFYALAIWRTPPNDLLGNSFLALNSLLGVAGLFWYWVGLDVLSDGKNLVDWLTKAVKTLVPGRILTISAFVLWIVWTALAYVLVYGIPLALVAILERFSLGSMLLRAYLALRPRITLDVTTALHWAVLTSIYFVPSIALIALILLGLRKLSHARITSLLALSVGLFVAAWGSFGLWLAFASGTTDSALGSWPMLIFLVGMFWQVLKVSSDLVAGGRTRSMLFLGFLLSLGGISLLELSAKQPLFQQELTLNSYLGVVYLGIPYVLYISLYQRHGYTLPSTGKLLLLFALGMLSAIPALLLRRGFLVPLLWAVSVLATVWRNEAWDDPWDGVVYLVASALGFTVFYTNPILLPIPYFTQFLYQLFELQSRYVGSRIWAWEEARWWWILLGAVGAAAIQGHLFFRAHRLRGRARWLLVLLGTVLAASFLGLLEFLFIGAR